MFYRANNGREGFFINLTGIAVKAFGANRFGLRFWSAVFGTAAVFFIALLGKELFTPRVGLWAAFFLATSFWHLLFSRIDFRAIMMPTLLLAAFYGLLKAWPTDSWRAAAWGGVAFGLGFHPYIAFRIAPLVAVAAFALWRPRGRKLKLAGVWLAIAFLVALPMAVHFIQSPEHFTSRTSQLSVFGEANSPTTLAVAFVKSALMFHWKGDCNGSQNLVCAPQIPRPLGALMLVGIAAGMGL